MLGHLAGLLTTIAVIPQIKKVFVTQKVDDISVPMFIVMLSGVTLWTVYGAIKGEVPILIFNGISAVLNGVMLVMIFKLKSE